jgi:hypothetical protein
LISVFLYLHASFVLCDLSRVPRCRRDSTEDRKCYDSDTANDCTATPDSLYKRSDPHFSTSNQSQQTAFKAQLPRIFQTFYLNYKNLPFDRCMSLEVAQASPATTLIPGVERHSAPGRSSGQRRRHRNRQTDQNQNGERSEHQAGSDTISNASSTFRNNGRSNNRARGSNRRDAASAQVNNESTTQVPPNSASEATPKSRRPRRGRGSKKQPAEGSSSTGEENADTTLQNADPSSSSPTKPRSQVKQPRSRRQFGTQLTTTEEASVAQSSTSNSHPRSRRTAPVSTADMDLTHV